MVAAGHRDKQARYALAGHWVLNNKVWSLAYDLYPDSREKPQVYTVSINSCQE